MRVFGQILMLAMVGLVLTVVAPVASFAQTAANSGKLILTVADPTGGVIPGATVTVVGLEPVTKTATIAPATTNDKGVAALSDLPQGRYSISATFPGFEVGLLRDIRVNRGDNEHIVVLPMKAMSESVTVGGTEQAADRS